LKSHINYLIEVKMAKSPHSIRILIVGCGDIGKRILPLLLSRLDVIAITRQNSHCATLRAAGAIPLVADLDEPYTLPRLAKLASHIIYLAPPPSQGICDTRSRHLAAVLSQRCRLVYISTTGVYGDCDGEWIDETHEVNPQNKRAVRRCDAELVWRNWARRTKSSLSILRVPGIYAADRLPVDRIKLGTPVLTAEQDVYTNHIHADDLARLVVQVLFHGRANRVYNAVDDSCLLMGEYVDLVADKFGLPHVPRLSRVELMPHVSDVMLSTLSESRRLMNDRIKRELGFELLYPTVLDGLNAYSPI
jgi:nucleoside-diphosphate-sugar epimerase